MVEKENDLNQIKVRITELEQELTRYGDIQKTLEEKRKEIAEIHTKRNKSIKEENESNEDDKQEEINILKKKLEEQQKKFVEMTAKKDNEISQLRDRTANLTSQSEKIENEKIEKHKINSTQFEIIQQ